MTLSYSGVTIGSTRKDLRDWCDRNLRLSDSIEFPSLIQSRDLLGMPASSVIDARPVRVGLLRWPKGASRFSVCNLIVTDNELAAITAATAGGIYSAYPLKLDWHTANHTAVYSISPPMYRLPPRPIAQPGGGSNGFWMLTLVDDRFFWWRRLNTALSITEGTTTWLQLYAAIATELNITLTADTPNAAYLKPPSAFATTYERLPLVLDAVAYSCGQRITANLDGTYRARNLSNGASDTAANSALPRKVLVAGGTFATPPTNAYAGTVLVTFPSFEGATPNGTTYTVSVAVANGRTADTKTFRSSAVARYTASVLQNGAELLTLTTQIAADYATANTPLVDAAYAGILPWVPDVISESIEWQYLPEGILTRVRFGVHDDNLDAVEDLLQAGGTAAGGTGPFSYVVCACTGSITISTTTPANPTTGSFFFNTTTQTLEVFYGGVWVYPQTVVSTTMPVTAVVGMLWLNSGVLQYWNGSTWVNVSTTSGSSVSTICVGTPNTTVANTTTPTSLIGTALAGSKSLTASYFTTDGQMLRVRASGVFSHATSGTVTFTVKDTANSVLYATANPSMTTFSGQSWSVSVDLTYSGGTVYAEGVLTTGTTDTVRFFGSVSPSASAQTLDLLMTWDVANPGDTITCNASTIEVLR